jgi:hypothetical protein
MNTVNPPPDSIERKNLEEVVYKMIIAADYRRKQTEDLARLLVNRMYPGKAFEDLDSDKKQNLLNMAKKSIKNMEGGKRRTKRRKVVRRKKYTQRRK